MNSLPPSWNLKVRSVAGTGKSGRRLEGKCELLGTWVMMVKERIYSSGGGIGALASKRTGWTSLPCGLGRERQEGRSDRMVSRAKPVGDVEANMF